MTVPQQHCCRRPSLCEMWRLMIVRSVRNPTVCSKQLVGLRAAPTECYVQVLPVPYNYECRTVQSNNKSDPFCTE